VLDRILEAVAFLSPLLIAIMSVIVGMRLAKNPLDQTYRRWWRGIIVLGILCSGATLWQQERGRNSHSDEVGHLNQSINGLKQDLHAAETSRASDAEDFKQRIDEINRFIAHVPSNFDSKRLAAAVHAMANPSDLPNFIAIGKLHEERLRNLIQEYDQFIRGLKTTGQDPSSMLWKVRNDQLHKSFMQEYYKDLLAYRTAALARLGRTTGNNLATWAYKQQAEIRLNAGPGDTLVGFTRPNLQAILSELSRLINDLQALTSSPQLASEIGKSLNPKSALETRFLLTNRNPLPITNVSYECDVHEGEGSAGIVHSMTGQAEDLPSGYSRSLSCDMVAGNFFVDRTNAPVLNLWVSYMYKNRKERTGFRFWTKRSQEGTFEWFPGGAGEELKPN